MTAEQLEKDEEIQTLLRFGDLQLQNLGYTEHGERHRKIVQERTIYLLKCAGAEEKDVVLGSIAAYLHDLGCFVNRASHAQSGALIAYPLLVKRGMSFSEAAAVAEAIANHDEKDGRPCSVIAAALIVADKSDVHRNRVRRDKVDGNGLIDLSDIHDRVNYSVTDSVLQVDAKSKKIIFRFTLDESVSGAMDYFEIFLGRMKMCKAASAVLGFAFSLYINGQPLA